MSDYERLERLYQSSRVAFLRWLEHPTPINRNRLIYYENRYLTAWIAYQEQIGATNGN